MTQTPARTPRTPCWAIRALRGPGVDVGGRDEPESAHRDNQQPGDDAALVPQLARQPSGRQRHQEVAEIVRELHPGGLRLGEAQFLLEVLVHHVDHPVADSPQEEQRTDQDEGEHQVTPQQRMKHTLPPFRSKPDETSRQAPAGSSRGSRTSTPTTTLRPRSGAAPAGGSPPPRLPGRRWRRWPARRCRWPVSSSRAAHPGPGKPVPGRSRSTGWWIRNAGSCTRRVPGRARELAAVRRTGGQKASSSADLLAARSARSARGSPPFPARSRSRGTDRCHETESRRAPAESGTPQEPGRGAGIQAHDADVEHRPAVGPMAPASICARTSGFCRYRRTEPSALGQSTP
jgi:hypothetical protein